MKTFGGIHIYDDKFRLPYYGPEDWLDIERDHARRLSRSQLVPENLRVSRGLNDLPSRRRLFGAAIISTAHEQETAPTRGLSETEALAIQVSRDRLSDNVAFGALRNLVRLGLDLYATEVARAKSAQTVGKRQQPEPTPRPSSDLAVVREIVEAVKPRLSNSEYDSLADYLTDAQQHAKVLEDTSDAQAALFGTLATVGMTTLAWEHEATKQRLVVLDAATSLKRALQGPPERLPATVEDQRARLVETAKRMNDVARLFRPVLDRESRETRVTLDARRFITRTAKQLDVLSRGAEVHTTGIPTDLKLPPGSSSGWSAILQNLLVNAFNAVLEEPRRDIDIDGGTTKNKDWIRIQDTGVGVDIADAENYFKPFVRGMGDDPRRAQLGLGGSGLGLTIVRMIADTMDVTVRFVAPEPPHSTAVIIEWKTTK
jgi:signal transduction histidine kinase